MMMRDEGEDNGRGGRVEGWALRHTHSAAQVQKDGGSVRERERESTSRAGSSGAVS